MGACRNREWSKSCHLYASVATVIFDADRNYHPRAFCRQGRKTKDTRIYVPRLYFGQDTDLNSMVRS